MLYRGEDGICLLNRFPYANGHLLAAPRQHVGSLSDLTEDQCAALIILVSKATDIVKKVMSPDGFNIGMNIGCDAGAGIADHLHVHIIPRWRGDHNFMTTIAEVRTIPEHIANTYDRLLPDFQKLSRNP